MIYSFEEYKVKIREAERLSFAKEYAIAVEPKKIIDRHNLLMESFENEDFMREMYDVYLRKKGVK